MQTRTLFTPRAGGLWIAGALLLLSVVGVVGVPSPLPPIPDASAVREILNSPPCLSEQPHILSRAPFQSSNLPPAQSDFYRTSIDNNLFRPLGWTPPRPIEPYRLLGTKLARDANTPPQVILQSTTGHQTYIVTLGSNLDANTQVVDIQSKQGHSPHKGSNVH